MSRIIDNSAMNPVRHSGPFLKLPENEFALEAIRQFEKAEKNSSQCLLVIQGAPGTGKSHLVRHSLKNLLQSPKNPKSRVLLTSEFAAQFAEASQNKSIQEFRDSFDDLQLLVLEDFTAIQGRRETQSHLVEVLDHILKNGGKCLITTTKMPGELSSVSVRLVNRCHGGLIAEMKLPDVKSREKLVRQMASYLQIPLSPSGIRMISESLAVSPRELESAIVQLDALSRLNKKIINDEFVKSYLAGEILTPTPSFSQITKAVSKQFGISVKKIRSDSRLKGHVRARQCAMYLMRELTEESLQKVASWFGRKNHSTVTHACNKIQELEKKEIPLKRQLRQIRNSLGISNLK